MKQKIKSVAKFLLPSCLAILAFWMFTSELNKWKQLREISERSRQADQESAEQKNKLIMTLQLEYHSLFKKYMEGTPAPVSAEAAVTQAKIQETKEKIDDVRKQVDETIAEADNLIRQAKNANAKDQGDLLALAQAHLQKANALNGTIPTLLKLMTNLEQSL